MALKKGCLNKREKTVFGNNNFWGDCKQISYKFEPIFEAVGQQKTNKVLWHFSRKMQKWRVRNKTERAGLAHISSHSADRGGKKPFWKISLFIWCNKNSCMICSQPKKEKQLSSLKMARKNMALKTVREKANMTIHLDQFSEKAGTNKSAREATANKSFIFQKKRNFVKRCFLTTQFRKRKFDW